MGRRPATLSRGALRRALVLAALAATWAACGATQPAQDAAAPSRSAAFDAALDDWAAAPGHEGVSASVILRDGSQWVGVAGTAGGSEPLLPEHLIWIASITKSMTGALVLQLADEGVLGLDDPVSRWLAPRRYVDASITLRQLLNHTNGLDNYTASPALGAAIAADADHVFTPQELLGFVGLAHFAPGARTEYTNTSFLLLGQVVEAATRQPVLELYRRRLWEPLGLGEIFLPGQEAPAGPVAPALSSAGIVPPLEHMSTLSIGQCAFGLMSNARTVARWGRALFAGGVISERMQQAMRTLVPAAGNIPGETGAGLGIRSYAYLGRQQIGHSGGAPFGSSLLLYEPGTGVTVAVLMNQGPGADHFVLAPRLLDIATRP